MMQLIYFNFLFQKLNLQNQLKQATFLQRLNKGLSTLQTKIFEPFVTTHLLLKTQNMF